MEQIAHPVVRLASHGYAVALDPARGGRIVSATYNGLDVLRPETGAGAESALDSACFPLVPFSNRIRHGAFEFEGHAYRLGSNWDGDAHAIHGEGWLRPWQVVAVAAPGYAWAEPAGGPGPMNASRKSPSANAESACP